MTVQWMFSFHKEGSLLAHTCIHCTVRLRSLSKPMFCFILCWTREMPSWIDCLYSTNVQIYFSKLFAFINMIKYECKKQCMRFISNLTLRMNICSILKGVCFVSLGLTLVMVMGDRFCDQPIKLRN